MYRQFVFEGDVHQALDCVPLVVRRKLDVAGLKISLAGWQALTRAERLALCHLPVDGAEDLAVYQEVMRAFAERAGAELKALPATETDAGAWAASAVPERVRTRAVELGCGAALEARWAGLDEEARYALHKLADPKREPGKLAAALGELGIVGARGGVGAG